MIEADEQLVRERLRRMDFARIRFDLELREELHWELSQALSLRSSLQRAAERVFRGPGGDGKLERLFSPPLSSDPEALRRFQKPAPPFNLLLPAQWPLELEPGELLVLDVHFWGGGTRLIEDFTRVLEAFGEAGLKPGEGRFEPTGLWSADAAGRWHPVLRSPIILDSGWWLDGSGMSDAPLDLQFVTPARLLSAGRPLFAPDFRKIFPFLLRRVTAMAHAHCGLELVKHPRVLLEAAAACPVPIERLGWTDPLLEGVKQRPLGGVTGDLRVDCRDHPGVGDLLRIASLMNLGRGAAYGAGGLRVRPVSPAS